MSFHHNIPYYEFLWFYRWRLLALAVLVLLNLVLIYALVRRARRGRPIIPRPSPPSLPSLGIRRRLRGIGAAFERIGDAVLAPLSRGSSAAEAEPESEAEPSESVGGLAPRLAKLLPSGDDDGDGDGFNPNWRAIGTAAFAALVIGGPLTIFFIQGAWPFGPWRGATILGLPAYWTVFFGMLALSLSILPIYIYFIAPVIPFAGGAMPRLMWIIASWAQGATIFDRSADGRYYARPMRKRKTDDGTTVAQMWVDGGWKDVPGNIEFVSRLAWRPVAFTWEKSDWAVQEIEATDMGEDPVDYLVERGMMDRETAVEFQPGGVSSAQAPQAAADGGVAYDRYGMPIEPGEGGVAPNGGVEEPTVPYNILDYRGHAYQAFNPFPNGGDDGEYVIDTRKVMFKLANSGETNLIQRAKDIALTDTAQTTRMSQVIGWMMIGGSLVFGVGVAYFTV